MSDIGDVLNTAKTLALATIFPPSGTVPSNSISPISNCAVTAGAGWPLADDLDAVAASLQQSPQRVIVSFYAPPGTWRNTTRYPLKWQQQTAGVTTLTVSIDDTGKTATIGGTAPGLSGPTQNVALILGFGTSRPQPFSYTVLGTDTLDSIATAVAALVNAATPASASGTAITIPAAFSLTGRVGGVATAALEVMRQTARMQVDVWAPSPTLRDAVATPIKAALAQQHFMTLPDGFGARVITRGDGYLDQAEKAGVYRRCLLYDVEYATTITAPAPVVIASEGELQGGDSAISGFTETVPPTVNAEA